MTKIAQVEDRGAAVAWSPVGDYADVIALGAKDSGTIGFDDRGGELELFDLGITSSTTNSTPTVIGSIKTTSRFSSIAWTTGTSTISDRFQMGLIAGGMDDGTINIWDSSSILHSSSSSDAPSSSKALLSSISRDSGAITALSFNPHPNSSNLLASGGRDGEILITSLDNPSQPTVTVPSADHSLQSAEITHTTWNSEVAHIVASSSGSGSAVVWDLRQNKPWCELRESSGGSVSDIAWNPGQGMHLITASSDDRSPVLKLWDLRASMSMPLATLEGHLSGVLGLAWCPHDTSLLVSCGKDNRTLLWDVNTLKSIAEIPNEERGDDSDNSEDCTKSSLLERLLEAMPSDWQNKETPSPGTRPWTLDEILALSDVPAWACQWTQTTNPNTSTNTNTKASPFSRSVSPCHQTHGGLPSARTRWNTFLTTHLSQYDRTRNQITRPHSVSRMSCYLNWGIVSVFRLCHDLTVARVKPTPSSSSSKQRTIRAGTLDKFEEEIIKWREFSYAHCYANPDTYDQREVLPLWVLRYLEQELRNVSDDCDNNEWNGIGDCLEGSTTTCPTWNAMQSYLETTGELHNNARMTWGKTIVHWLKHSHDGGDILRTMCYLNDRYALDGLAPPSYAGILWCLGWGDKPGRRGGISVKDSSRYRCGPEGFRTAQDLVLGSVSIIYENEQNGNTTEVCGGEGNHRRCTQKSITDHVVSIVGALSSSRKRLVRTEEGTQNTDGGITPTKVMKVGSSIEKNKKTLKSYFALKQSMN